MYVRPFLLAAALFATATAAHADTYDFTLSGFGAGFDGSGSLTVMPTSTSGVFTVTGITGSGSSGPIAVNGFGGNDNLFFTTPSSYFDTNGLSFYDQNSSGVFQVRLYGVGGQYFASFNEINTATPFAGTVPVTFTTTSTTPAVAATPEPSSLALLGTGVVGILGAARRKFLS